MSKKEIGVLVCRIMALYFLYPIFAYLPTLFGSPNMSVHSIISMTGAVLGAVLLWIFAEPLANQITAGMDQEETVTGISARQLHIIAFSVLGVYFIGLSVVDNMNSFAQHALVFQGGASLPKFVWPQDFRFMIKPGAQLLFGLGILAYAKPMARSFHAGVEME